MLTFSKQSLRAGSPLIFLRTLLKTFPDPWGEGSVRSWHWDGGGGDGSAGRLRGGWGGSLLATFRAGIRNGSLHSQQIEAPC